MKRPGTAIGLMFGLGWLLALVVLPARLSFASFTSSCSVYQFANFNVRRLDAQAYATVANHEGYEWGGGCWNTNNRDDTPGVPDSNGEGPDCSGLVFKTWELRNTANDSGFTYYQAMQNIHGVYTSYDFHSPVGSDPFSAISKSGMMYMDAFAKNGHVAILWTGPGTDAGTDYVLEAYTDAVGVRVASEAYRSDSAYTGAIRENWTPDCWPRCKSAGASVVVVP
jgi:hypothetical protein